MRNPFDSHAAGTDLDRDLADVAEINGSAFQDCQELIADVRQYGQTRAMLLYGEPGSGKTHLLGRLKRWLDQRATDGELSAFVPIRMAAHSRMLWRFIREHLAEALLRKQNDGRRLIQLVLKRNPEEIAESNRDLAIILGNLIWGVRVVDSSTWLKGHDLPQTALDALELAPARDEEDLESASARIVKDLCKYIAPVPVVFCFDQLESIQSHAGDKSGFFQFGALGSALFDGTRNLAIFSCLQTALINDLQGGMRAPDAERLTSQRSAMLPLGFDQACQLAAARLDSIEEIREQRRNHTESIWPLNAKALKAAFPAHGTLVARKVIVLCKELFDQWQTGQISKNQQTVEEFLEQNFQSRLQATVTEKSDTILRTGLPTLFRLRGLRFEPVNPQQASILEGTLQSKTATAIAVCNQNTQGNGLSKRFEKLKAEWPEQAPALAIFRDARRGISANAISTRKGLKALEDRGGRLILAEPEALAALNALNELLADARSGDLSLDGDTVPLTTVEQWLTAHLPPPLDELLESVAQTPTADLVVGIVDLVNKKRVVLLDDAARELNLTPEEVEAIALRNPALFGFAGGSTRVLYRAVPAV